MAINLKSIKLKMFLRKFSINVYLKFRDLQHRGYLYAEHCPLAYSSHKKYQCYISWYILSWCSLQPGVLPRTLAQAATQVTATSAASTTTQPQANPTCGALQLALDTTR